MAFPSQTPPGFGKAVGGSGNYAPPPLDFGSFGGSGNIFQVAAPEAAIQPLKPLQKVGDTQRISDGPFGSLGFSGFGVGSSRDPNDPNIRTPAQQAREANPIQNVGSFSLPNPAYAGFGTGAQAQAQAPLGGGGGNYSIDRAFGKTEQNQNFVQDLLMNGGNFGQQFTGSPIGQQIQQGALQPQGFTPEALAALRRDATGVIAGAADQSILDQNNQLAARGFGDSAIGPRFEADTRAGAARDAQSAMQNIDLQNQQLTMQNQQAAINQYLQLLQQQTQAQQGAASTIAGFQYPFVQDGSGGGGGSAQGSSAYSGGAASGGVGSYVDQGTGKIVGSNGQLTGGLPSNFDQFGRPLQVGQFSQQDYGSLGANAIRMINNQRAQLNATPDNPYQLIRF